MLKKQFREFLKLLGFEENITDETLEYLVQQMEKMLEFDVQNSFSFKTGYVLHQLTLKNQKEIREVLEEQVRSKNMKGELPRFQFSWNRICLNLEEDYTCKVKAKLKMPDLKCSFVANVIDCDIVQQSVKTLENWT